MEKLGVTIRQLLVLVHTVCQNLRDTFTFKRWRIDQARENDDCFIFKWVITSLFKCESVAFEICLFYLAITQQRFTSIYGTFRTTMPTTLQTIITPHYIFKSKQTILFFENINAPNDNNQLKMSQIVGCYAHYDSVIPKSV